MLGMLLIGVWPGPAFDPRDYCEFEGVLVPLDGLSLIVNGIAFAAVLGGTAIVAALNQRKPSTPTRNIRVRRLFYDANAAEWARWN